MLRDLTSWLLATFLGLASIAQAAPPTARIIVQRGHASPISAAAWTPDGKFLVTGSTDAQLLVWNLVGQVIGRAALGAGDDRTVVERIAVARDGSVTVDQLWFKEMFDNGVASELRRRTFRYRFGDDAADEIAGEPIAPPWPGAMSFRVGSLAARDALFARRDWPRSRDGWHLIRSGKALVMQSPGGATIPLVGALGPSTDNGDRRIAATAAVLERRARMQMQAMKEGRAGSLVPLAERPPDAPIFSQDGALVTWRGERGAMQVFDLNSSVARGAAVLPGKTAGAVDPTAVRACPTGGAPPAICRTTAGQVAVRSATTGVLRCTLSIDQGDPVPAAFVQVSADRSLAMLQSDSGYVEIFRLPRPRSATDPGNERCSSLTAFRGSAGWLGFHPTKPLLWREERGQGLAFYSFVSLPGGTARPLFTLYRLTGNHFFVLAHDGRYDTDLGPDSDAVRWQVSDTPFQSFPAQTFMRDYYEPRLASRLIECTATGNCAAALPPVPPIAALNRVLPRVTITAIKQGAARDIAIVTVNVGEGRDPTAANGKTRSGVYGVRLFRDGKLFRQFPDPFIAGNTRTMAAADASARTTGMPGDNPDLVDAQLIATAARDLDGWRALNRLKAAHDDKTVDLNFELALPTAAGTEVSRFSAYAFNEDRVKGETVSTTYRRPFVPSRPPRAFVVTVGVDVYDETRLTLNFAASDARLIADRLAEIPGYEVRRVSLDSVAGIDGKPRRVVREALDLVFGAMAGADLPGSQVGLRALGFDGSNLDLVRPDDIVIVSFSGHGWTDPRGDFYLLPADARWRADAPLPDPSTLVSAARLSIYLGGLQAQEVAVIIDACHSAASVTAAGFKPGPMGDAGLGQLAFDKGIRLLAASQADDVALESVTLRQGLLTYALAGEGLRPNSFVADLNRDGKITTDEWLRYGVARLPAISSDILAGRPVGRLRGVVLLDGPLLMPKSQEPALFDFTGKPSVVVLRARSKAVNAK